jgi:hypothetical protein
MAFVAGWNRNTWNSGPWNGPVPVEVTGVSAASGIGSIQISFAFTVEGVSAIASVSQATVWGVIDTSETPSWSSISSSQTPSWTKIAA